VSHSLLKKTTTNDRSKPILTKTKVKGTVSIVILYLVIRSEKILTLRGLSHEIDLAFDDMVGYLGLNRRRGYFLNLGAPMIL
jgi:hypothetical protein